MSIIFTYYIKNDLNSFVSENSRSSKFDFNVLNGNLSKMYYFLSCLVKQNKWNIN